MVWFWLLSQGLTEHKNQEEQMKKVSFKNQCILNVKKYCKCWIGDEKTWHGSVNVDAF